MLQDRRTFLATLGAAAVGTFSAVRDAHVLPAARMERIGLQLYTVRSAMERSVEDTLARVAEIGYREVEFAGYFGRAPAAIAALLREHALAAPSAHAGFEQLHGDWSAVLAGAAEVGHRYVTVPWLPAEQRTPDAYHRHAELFNRRAAEARAAGLRFSYHNHDFEFARSGDVIPFDVLLAGTDPELVEFELDIYWITKAGHDPLDYFSRFPGRFAMTHLKDSGGPPDHRMVDVGSGVIDFARVVAAANAAGVRHHFVEHDRPDDPFASIRSSYQHLAGLNV